MAPSPSGRKGSREAQPLPFRQLSPRVPQRPGRLRYLAPAGSEGRASEGLGIFSVRDLAPGQACDEGRRWRQQQQMIHGAGIEAPAREGLIEPPGHEVRIEVRIEGEARMARNGAEMVVRDAPINTQSTARQKPLHGANQSRHGRRGQQRRRPLLSPQGELCAWERRAKPGGHGRRPGQHPLPETQGTGLGEGPGTERIPQRREGEAPGQVPPAVAEGRHHGVKRIRCALSERLQARLPEHGGDVRFKASGHIGARFRKKRRIAIAREQAIERALGVRLEVGSQAPGAHGRADKGSGPGRGRQGRGEHRIEAIENQPFRPPGGPEHHVEIVVAKAVPENPFPHRAAGVNDQGVRHECFPKGNGSGSLHRTHRFGKERIMTRTVVGTVTPGLPLSPAIISGDFIFCSGQLGIDSERKLAGEDVTAQTVQALENLSAVLAEAGASLSDVVKVTTFLTRPEDAAAYNAVYQRYFPEAPPARSTVISGLLLPGAVVEIEAIAAKPQG